MSTPFLGSRRRDYEKAVQEMVRYWCVSWRSGVVMVVDKIAIEVQPNGDDSLEDRFIVLVQCYL